MPMLKSREFPEMVNAHIQYRYHRLYPTNVRSYCYILLVFIPVVINELRDIFQMASWKYALNNDNFVGTVFWWIYQRRFIAYHIAF